MGIYLIFRWVVGLAFGLFGWMVILMNLRIAYVGIVRREHHSWIPLVGGFFALVGMAICPLTEVRRWAWIPITIDLVYCILMLSIGLVMMCVGRRNRDV